MSINSNSGSSRDKGQQEISSKDCLACRTIGTLGLLGISMYLFRNGSMHIKAHNRLVIHACGTGKINLNIYQLLE
jgi:hypothetical protein